MKTIKIRKNLYAIAVILLLSLSAFQLQAQEEDVKKDKEVRVKVVKESDEGRTVIDTTILIGNVISDEELMEIKSTLSGYGLENIDLEIGIIEEMLEDIEIEIEELDVENGEKEVIIVRRAGPGSGSGDKKVHVSVTTGDTLDGEKTIRLKVGEGSYGYVIMDGEEIQKVEGREGGMIMLMDEDGEKIRVVVGEDEELEWVDAEGAVQMTVEVDDDGEVYVIKSGDEILELKGVKSDHMMILKGDGSKDGEKEVFVEVFETKEGDHSVRIKSTLIVSSLNEKDRKTLEKAGVDIRTEGDDPLQLKRLAFHPNPSDGKFKVTFEAEAGEAIDLQVFSITGQEVFSKKLRGQDGRYEQEIDLSAEKSGAYFLRLSRGNQGISKKIILE